MVDKRIYTRANIHMPIELQVLGEPLHKQQGYLVNVSAGGMLLEMEQDLALGEQILVHIPGLENVMVVARVVRQAQEKQFGCQFINFVPKHHEELQQLIDQFLDKMNGVTNA